ncbi:hypothetical protein [Bacillus andreraoultii]|uniref:hypothetical protein n=1 Tax=Bacillus andreraoultii TaxID=1499685 RepID=UPI00053A6F71|nr:hypothetical protein [Bacillus andreraoultii]
MVDQSSFQILSRQINVDTSRKVDYVQIQLVANDAGKTPHSTNTDEPAIYITDIMFQGGTVATSWVGHVSEIRWSFDVA